MKEKKKNRFITFLTFLLVVCAFVGSSFLLQSDKQVEASAATSIYDDPNANYLNLDLLSGPLPSNSSSVYVADVSVDVLNGSVSFDVSYSFESTAAAYDRVLGNISTFLPDLEDGVSYVLKGSRFFGVFDNIFTVYNVGTLVQSIRFDEPFVYSSSWTSLSSTSFRWMCPAVSTSDAYVGLSLFRADATDMTYTPYGSWQTDEEDSSSSSEDSSSSSEDSSSSSEDDGAYDDGYQDGYDDGYLAGSASGAGSSLAGIFYDGSVSGTLIDVADENDENYTNVSFGPYNDLVYLNGGIDFSQFVNRLDALAPNGYSQTEIYFDFANDVLAQSLSLIGVGNSTSFLANFVLIDTNNTSYECTWIIEDSAPNCYTLVLPSSLTASSSVYIDKFYVKWGGGVDGLSVSILDRNNTYLGGYLVGKNDGYLEGLEKGEGIGYDLGYNEGHRIGYDDGYSVGILKNNSFFGLMTAVVEAPVKVFIDLVDFEVLGYNMKQVALSLLTIALVICVIRWFSKGSA